MVATDGADGYDEIRNLVSGQWWNACRGLGFTRLMDEVFNLSAC